ncbi:MAG: tetratricopeptide repeat protein, partial [Candidatus Riflebacteria bacterium]
MNTARDFFEKGIDLQQRGLYDHAIEEYEKALNIEPDNADVLVNLGAACLQKGLADRAVKVLVKVLDRDPQNSAAYYNIGKAFYYRDEVPDALAAFQRAENILPEDLDIKKMIFICLVDLKKFEESAELGLSIAEKMIKDSDFLMRLGEVLLSLESYEQSLDVYRKAAAVACSSTVPLMGIYRAQLALGNREKAITSLKRAMMVEPENQNFIVMMVDHLLEDGKIQEAAEILKKGMESIENPTIVREKYNELTRRLPILRKKADSALKVRQSPYEADVYDVLDHLYDGKIALDVAVIELEKLRRRDPADLFIARELANLHFQGRNFDQAAEIYSEALLSVPSDTLYRVELAKSLAMKGDAEAARAVLKDAVRDLGHTPELAIALVELDLFEKEFARAAGRLDMVLNEYPDEPHALFLYAYTALRLNELDTADRTFRRLLEKNPGDEETVIWFSRLALLQNDPERALEAWKKFDDGLNSMVEIISRIELTLSSGDSRGIIRYLQRIGDYHPRFIEDHLLFGKAFFFAGDFSSAQREFDLVLKYEARNAEALAMSAMNSLIRNKATKFWNYWLQAIDNDSLYAVIPAIVLRNSLNFSQKERLKSETRK